MLNNAVDAYSGFVLDAAHTITPWLRLQAPGANTVAVAHTDGGADTTITFAFADAWALRSNT